MWAKRQAYEWLTSQFSTWSTHDALSQLKSREDGWLHISETIIQGRAVAKNIWLSVLLSDNTNLLQVEFILWRFEKTCTAECKESKK